MIRPAGKKAAGESLSPQARRHGQRQVRAMLRDRPVMADRMGPDDAPWRWAARKFAGEGLPATIDWDPRPPYHGARAAHLYPCATERGCIQVRKGLPFEVSWAGAVFELLNIALHAEFRRVIRQAHRGSLNRREFARRMARIEFRVVRQSARFYQEVWRPWARRKGRGTDPYEWNVGVPRSFEAWLRGFGEDSDYPWQVYADFYDEHLAEWAAADRLGGAGGPSARELGQGAGTGDR